MKSRHAELNWTVAIGRSNIIYHERAARMRISMGFFYNTDSMLHTSNMN